MKCWRLGLVAAVLVGMASATATADTVVFYREVGGPDANAVLQLSGPGPWDLELRAIFDGDVQGWGIDPASTVANLSMTNLVPNGVGFPFFVAGTAPGTAPPRLTDGLGYLNILGPNPPFQFPPAGTYTLATMTLNAGTDPLPQDVFGIVNVFEWVNANTGVSFNVSFAGGPAAPRAVDDVTGTMITIIPEPATLIMVGIGVVGLLRRRRR